MGNVRPRLKRGVLPHIFHCQSEGPTQPVEEEEAQKRRPLQLIEEAMEEVEQKQKLEAEESTPVKDEPEEEEEEEEEMPKIKRKIYTLYPVNCVEVALKMQRISS